MEQDDLQLPKWDGTSLSVAEAFEVLSLEPGCGLPAVNRRYVLIAGANFPGLVFRDGDNVPHESKQVRLLMDAYRLVRDAEVRRTNVALPSPPPARTTGPRSDAMVEVALGAGGLPTITPEALNAYARGQSLLAAGAPLRAYGSFDRACDLYPGNPLFELMRSWSHYVAGRSSPRETEIHLEKTVNALPGFLPDLKAECWVMMARIALDRRDYASARQRYRAALEYAPRHLEASAGAVARPETPSPSGPAHRPHTESLP